jgi:demethylmenaquinone methyltransferase/2-methoxy-6-polyprenyl-1,4-benzoquinol methylase
MKTYNPDPESIQNLFNNIAPTYDMLNHILSFGSDILWRKKAAHELRGVSGWILDIATGTGDLAIEIIHQDTNKRKVLGLDFSRHMIGKAHKKLQRKGLSNYITLSLGDAIALPFREDTFSATIIAFGLRNIIQKDIAISEMKRVTKNGGKVVILEFTLPSKGLMNKLYPIYFKRILPWIGGIISGDREAYSYLPQSIIQFQNAEDYEGLLERYGLEVLSVRKLTWGIASIIVGMKK